MSHKSNIKRTASILTSNAKLHNRKTVGAIDSDRRCLQESQLAFGVYYLSCSCGRVIIQPTL